MTDNKRAAEHRLPAAWVEAILAYGDARADKNLTEGIASLKKAIKLIRAALSGCADGGKGEAVAVAFIEGDDVQRVLRWNKDVAAFNYEIGTSLYTAPQAECAPIAPRADADTAGAHIASIYADADGTKHVQLDVEDIDDIPVGTKLYLPAPTLTRAEIEEIAGYAENEGKACGISSLYIAAETAIEETLRRLAAPPASQERADAGKDAALTDAARDVLAERQRQMDKEGWTPKRDDRYVNEELALAAIVYAESAVGYHTEAPDTWPWHPDWFKPTTPRRDLVKACALLIAEIERTDRAILAAPIPATEPK